MVTTIQVSESTKQLLASLKKGTDKTYDEIVRELALKKAKVPKSMKGAYPELRWSKKDRMKFDGEI